MHSFTTSHCNHMISHHHNTGHISDRRPSIVHTSYENPHVSHAIHASRRPSIVSTTYEAPIASSIAYRSPSITRASFIAPIAYRSPSITRASFIAPVASSIAYRSPSITRTSIIEPMSYHHSHAYNTSYIEPVSTIVHRRPSISHHTTSYVQPEETIVHRRPSATRTRTTVKPIQSTGVQTEYVEYAPHQKPVNTITIEEEIEEQETIHHRRPSITQTITTSHTPAIGSFVYGRSHLW